MAEQLAPLLTLLAALGAGTMGGFFYAFSGLVMPSLARLPVGPAIAAMQTINIVVLNPLFFALFFGTAALSIALVLLAAIGAAPVLAASGGVVYLAAVIGVTMAANVPLNDRLARLDAGSADAEAVWADYLRRWTMWNHVRAGGGAAALALLLASVA